MNEMKPYGEMGLDELLLLADKGNARASLKAGERLMKNGDFGGAEKRLIFAYQNAEELFVKRNAALSLSLLFGDEDGELFDAAKERFWRTAEVFANLKDSFVRAVDFASSSASLIRSLVQEQSADSSEKLGKYGTDEDNHRILERFNEMFEEMQKSFLTETIANDWRLHDALSSLSAEQRRKIEAKLIEGGNESLVSRLKCHFFEFRDIARLCDRSVQKLLREIDTQELVMALKGGKEYDVFAACTSNMSRRAAALLFEDIEYISVKNEEIEKAQEKIRRVAERLLEDGELSFKN